MSEWENRPLGELTFLIKDGTHGSYTDVADGVPLLSAKDIEKGLVQIPDNCRRISFEAYKTIHSTYELCNNDILLTIVGTIGRVALFTKVSFKITFQRSVAIIRTDNNILNPTYFYHYINGNEFQNKLNAFKNASAQGGVYLGALNKINIYYPTFIPEQRKIARILSTVDEVIEKTEAAIAKYKAIKQGMMHDLFTRGIDVNTGKLRPSFEDAPELYKKTELGWLPKEWEIIKLIKLASPAQNSFVNGPFGSDLLSSELCDTGVPVIYVQDVKKDGYKKISTAHVSIEKANRLAFCNVRTGDILVAKVGTPPGDSAVYYDNQRAVITQDVIRIRPSVEMNGEYIVALLNSDIGSKIIREIMIEGTRGRLSLTDFKKSLMPVAHIEEQIKIAKYMNRISNKIHTEIAELAKMKNLKQGLMADLLTGKVRVKYEEESMEAM